MMQQGEPSRRGAISEQQWVRLRLARPGAVESFLPLSDVLSETGIARSPELCLSLGISSVYGISIDSADGARMAVPQNQWGVRMVKGMEHTDTLVIHEPPSLPSALPTQVIPQVVHNLFGLPSALPGYSATTEPAELSGRLSADLQFSGLEDFAQELEEEYDLIMGNTSAMDEDPPVQAPPAMHPRHVSSAHPPSGSIQMAPIAALAATAMHKAEPQQPEAGGEEPVQAAAGGGQLKAPNLAALATGAGKSQQEWEAIIERSIPLEAMVLKRDEFNQYNDMHGIRKVLDEAGPKIGRKALTEVRKRAGGRKRAKRTRTKKRACKRWRKAKWTLPLVVALKTVVDRRAARMSAWPQVPAHA